MKRIVFAILMLSYGLAIGVSQAGAHTTSYPTTLDFMHFEGYPGNALLSGLVVSDKKTCVAGRTAKLIIARPTVGKLTLDTTKTSSTGAYGLHASFNGSDTAYVKITGRKVGRHGHKQACEAVTVNVYTPV